MNDPTVRLADLPNSVHGFCYHDDDGEDYIILNSRDTREMNLKTYNHERGHLERGEMYNQNYIEY